MIYTVTFNPALDYIIDVDKLTLNFVNRTNNEEILYGGKGINVSTVLNNLGFENIALGFIAGFTGDEIESGLKNMGIKTDFIRLDNGFSRINIKVRSNGETEINGQGPNITETAINELFEKIDRIADGDILVLAGSIPKTLPENIYEKIMERVNEKNLKIVVDATKDLLINVLKYKPFLIKPNNHELSEIFNVQLTSDEDIIHYAKEIQKLGARNVLVSMAGDGALLITEDGRNYKSKVPEGKLVNSVGSGDSMVAGFIAGYIEKNDYEYAFKMGVASGSASAFSEKLATKKEIFNLLKQL